MISVCKRKIIVATLSIIGFVQAKGQVVVELYQDSIPNSISSLGEEDIPTLTIYKPAKEKISGTAVIIFPGGAYSFHAFNEEGIVIAKAFAEKGVTSFVVKYRLPNDELMRDKSMVPLMDAQQSIKFVRMHAVDYGVDSNKIGVIGFSAGGHLASTLGTHFSKSYIPNKESTNLRPDFMILVYPVISMDNALTHHGSRVALLGESVPKDKVIFFSNEEQVTRSTPPTYLTHCEDDVVVSVENSMEFYKACIENNVPAEMHLYPKGNHGFTQRLLTNEWLDPMIVFLKKQGFYP